MTNELHRESSLYLRQHQNNPVNWLPWTKNAFERANHEHKPIFLSIGYSSCHWCHVMAHECFEDDDVAKLLNKDFICIKLDKEERPDIDHIYQKAHYIFAQRPGGWPLSVFMTPNQEPFYIATFLPKFSKYNLPGMIELLPRIAELYKSEKQIIEKQSDQIKSQVVQYNQKKDEEELINLKFRNSIRDSVIKNLDHKNGGFGGAQKFPNESNFNFILKNFQSNSHSKVFDSIKKIINSGLFDHLEGGFFRYCVDEKWTIPHYEKMLYNSAQMVGLLTKCFAVTKNDIFYQKIFETINWLKKDMTDSHGYFFSSIDADSKNLDGVLEEGAYYNLSSKELEEIFHPHELNELRKYFFLEGEPNYEGEKWHLIRQENSESEKFHDYKIRLADHRKSKTKPEIDKKMIVSWNALMSKALIFSGRILNDENWVNLGQKNLDFIFRYMFADNKLTSIYEKNKKINGYLDDYAFVLDALIESMQANFREEDYVYACNIGGLLIEKFQSNEGAFFFTEHMHENLFNREIITEDNATPSGNAVAINALQKLSQISRSAKLDDQAYRALDHLNGHVRKNPFSHPSMLLAYEYFLSKRTTIFIYGDKESTKIWLKEIPEYMFLDHLVITFNTKEQFRKVFNDQNITIEKGAYVCENQTCYPPCKKIDELLEILSFKEI